MPGIFYPPPKKKYDKIKQPSQGKIAEWVEVLSVSAWGPEFKTWEPISKARHGCSWVCKWLCCGRGWKRAETWGWLSAGQGIKGMRWSLMEQDTWCLLICELVHPILTCVHTSHICNTHTHTPNHHQQQQQLRQPLHSSLYCIDSSRPQWQNQSLTPGNMGWFSWVLDLGGLGLVSLQVNTETESEEWTF